MARVRRKRNKQGNPAHQEWLALNPDMKITAKGRGWFEVCSKNVYTQKGFKCGLLSCNSKGKWGCTHNAIMSDDDHIYTHDTPQEAWVAYCRRVESRISK